VTTPVAPTPDPDPTPGDTVAPTDPTIAAVPVAFGGSFKVFVTVGASFDAGGLDRYTVSLNDQFNRTLDPDDFVSDAFPFELGPGDGLAEGTEYVITVTAVDLAGNASQTVGKTFTTPVLTPPFLLTTLGTATPAATAGFSNLLTGEFLGYVGGTGIGGTADSGGFAYTPAPADDNFSITGRVASLFGGNPHGGIAIREGIAAGAPMVSFTVAADGASLRTRSTANANAVGQAISVTPAIWLRLEYASGAITASTSPDGVTWTVRGTTSLTFNGVPLVGFVYASRENGTATTAAFDSFASVLTPPDTTAPSVPTLSATTTGTGSIRLDWTASTDAASGVREYRLTRNTVSIANVPFGVLTYTDTGLAAGTAYTYGIRAVDNAGNVSAEDTEIATTTAVASDLGTWLPLPAIDVSASTTLATDLAPYYVPPSGFKLDSLAISTTNETGGAVTAAYPSGTSGSIVSSTQLQIAAGSTTGAITNLHVVPTISAVGSGTEGTAGANASWATRSAGAIYANNFSQYASSAELSAAGRIAAQPPRGATDGEYLLYTGGGGPATLSGGKCLEIRTYDAADENGGNWSFRPPGRINNFYLQFHVALNRAARDWVRQAIDSGPKLLTLNQSDQTGGGQIALYNPRYLGFPGVFTDGSGGVERNIGGSGGKANDWFYCPAIDNGGSEATNLDQVTRYGPSRYLRAILNPISYVGTNAADNYVDARGFSHPHPNALASGVPEYLIDDWLCLEFYVSAVPSAGGDVAKLYAAHRGDTPKLIWSLGVPLTGNGSPTKTTLGGSLNGYNLFSFMNYSTNSPPEPGYRPTMKVWIAEVILSTSWRGFPGHEASPEPT
jgi:hypothetical protein